MKQALTKVPYWKWAPGDGLSVLSRLVYLLAGLAYSLHPFVAHAHTPTRTHTLSSPTSVSPTGKPTSKRRSCSAAMVEKSFLPFILFQLAAVVDWFLISFILSLTAFRLPTSFSKSLDVFAGRRERGLASHPWAQPALPCPALPCPALPFRRGREGRGGGGVRMSTSTC